MITYIKAKLKKTFLHTNINKFIARTHLIRKIIKEIKKRKKICYESFPKITK